MYMCIYIYIYIYTEHPRKAVVHFFFSIENFYPSVSMELFNKALQFAKSLCKITNEVISIIMQARKTPLFNDNEPWVK